MGHPHNPNDLYLIRPLISDPFSLKTFRQIQLNDELSYAENPVSANESARLPL